VQRIGEQIYAQVSIRAPQLLEGRYRYVEYDKLFDEFQSAPLNCLRGDSSECL